MHLYHMHKRDVLLLLSGFLATFILLLFIGLAGPNTTKINSVSAQDLFQMKNLNESIKNSLLPSGPFILSSPAISVYSEHLRLWVSIFNCLSKKNFNKICSNYFFLKIGDNLSH